MDSLRDFTDFLRGVREGCDYHKHYVSEMTLVYRLDEFLLLLDLQDNETSEDLKPL